LSAQTHPYDPVTQQQLFDKPSILTYSGGRVNPLDLKPEEVNPIDIANALSKQCRYTGHTDWFYSVAQHCVIIHDYLAAQGYPDDILEWALLHDSDECYLLDLAAPVKHSAEGFGEPFKKAAAKILKVVAERFDLELPEPPIVKQIDVQLRETELSVLFPRATDRHHYGDPLPVTILDWGPTEAKMQFMWRLQSHGFVHRDENGDYQQS
jgi:hypothetical protein